MVNAAFSHVSLKSLFREINDVPGDDTKYSCGCSNFLYQFVWKRLI